MMELGHGISKIDIPLKFIILHCFLSQKTQDNHCFSILSNQIYQDCERFNIEPLVTFHFNDAFQIRLLLHDELRLRLRLPFPLLKLCQTFAS